MTLPDGPLASGSRLWLQTSGFGLFGFALSSSSAWEKDPTQPARNRSRTDVTRSSFGPLFGCFCQLGILFLGVLIISAPLFGVYIKANKLDSQPNACFLASSPSAPAAVLGRFLRAPIHTYSYVHTHIYICMYIHIDRIFSQKYIRVFVYIYIHMYIYICTSRQFSFTDSLGRLCKCTKPDWCDISILSGVRRGGRPLAFDVSFARHRTHFGETSSNIYLAVSIIWVIFLVSVFIIINKSSLSWACIKHRYC